MLAAIDNKLAFLKPPSRKRTVKELQARVQQLQAEVQRLTAELEAANAGALAGRNTKSAASPMTGAPITDQAA